MSRQAFLTGATGFLGSQLKDQLLSAGWTVHALVRGASRLPESANLRVYEGDITDEASIRTAMPERPDAVFHVAASTNLWTPGNAQQTRINVGGTQNILNCAVDKQARRLIHTSSIVTWGFRNELINEDAPRTASSDWINYVRSKHEAEQRVLHAVDTKSLDAVILNPANILGPGDRQNWSRVFRLVNRRQLPGAPPGAGNFADVREVAAAHIRAFERGTRGQKYLLGGPYATYIELIRIAGERLGQKTPSRPIPAAALRGWARCVDLVSRVTRKIPDITPEAAHMVTFRANFDSSRAQRELDYQFTPLDVLVSDTIDWMESQGLL